MGNQPFGGGMQLLTLFSILSPLLFSVLPTLLLAFLVIYVLGWADGRRGGVPDRLLGAAVVLTLLMTVGSQLVLFALAYLLAQLAEEVEFAAAFRQAAGYFAAGVTAAGYAAVVYGAKVRGRGGSRVPRQALGLNAIVTGLVFVGALTFALVALTNEGDRFASTAAVAVVYFGGHLLCGLPLLSAPREVVLLADESPGGGPPAVPRPGGVPL